MIGPLHLLNIAAFAAAGGWTILHRKQFDLVTATFLGAAYFWSPLLAAHGDGIGGPYQFPASVRLTGAGFWAAFMGLGHWWDRGRIARRPLDMHAGPLIGGLWLFVALAFLAALPWQDFGNPKNQISSARMPFILAIYTLTTLAMVGLGRRRLSTTIVILAVTALGTIVTQSRSMLALVVLAIAIRVGLDNPGQRTMRAMILLAGTAGVALAAFDQVKGRLLRGDWDALPSPTHIADNVFWNSNAQVIMQTFSRVATSGERIAEPGEYMAGVVVAGIPLSETFVGHSPPVFGHVLGSVLYPERSAGFGNGPWAEAWAWGGPAAALIAIIAFLTFTLQLNRWYASETWGRRIFAILVGPTMALTAHTFTAAAVVSGLGLAIGFALILWIAAEAVVGNAGDARRSV